VPKDHTDQLSILNLGTADPFYPTWLDGLVLWLRADHFEDPYTAPSESDPVTIWHDSSGNDNHAYQTDPSKAPVYTSVVHGDPAVSDTIPCLDFDRAAGRYMTGSLGTLTSPCTIFLAVRWASDASQGANNDCVITIGGEESAFQTVTVGRSGDNAFFPDAAYYYFYLNPVSSYTGSYVPGDEFVIQSSVHDSTSPRHYSSYNGVYRTTDDYSSSGSMTYPDDDEYFTLINTDGEYCLGAYKKNGSDPNTFFDGQLSEVIVYNRALSIKEHEAVTFYLSIKYQLDLVEALSPLEPSSLLCYYSADTIGSIADGDVLSIWPDQSGNSHDLIRQEDPYAAIPEPENPYESPWERGPFYAENVINGLPAIQFDYASEEGDYGQWPVTGDWMETQLGELNAPFTIYLVARWAHISQGEANASFNTALKIGTGINPEGAIVTISRFYLAFGVFVWFDSYACAVGNDTAVTARGLNTNEWTACTSIHQPDVYRRNTFYVNQRALLVGRYDSNSQTSGVLSVGRGVAEYFSIVFTSHFRGHIAEMAIFDREMTKVERLSIEQYLMNKYDLPETTPGDEEPYVAS